MEPSATFFWRKTASTALKLAARCKGCGIVGGYHQGRTDRRGLSLRLSACEDNRLEGVSTCS